MNNHTNNALVQAFNVNNLNELTLATNNGTLTVAGTTTSTATNVTVNTTNAVVYLDATFAATNFTVTNGNNTFKAIAKDSYGRLDTNSITVNLPATNNYTYDLNGNLTSDGTRGFDYDDENQLIRVTVTNAWKSEFTYDGKLRRRIRKEYTWTSTWVQTNEVRYVYDGNLVIQERDANNLPTVSYTRGRDLSGTLEGAGGIGGLLAFSQHSTISPQHSYYHSDGNGNVTALINALQLIVAKYLYDPFGNILSQSGPLADANLYRFSSKEFHPNSGMVYYLYRFYEPNLQRWPNRDPIQELGGLNVYEYTKNAPTIFVDLWGLDTECDCLRLGGKYQSQAEHDFNGSMKKCIESRNGSLWGSLAMTGATVVGGAIGGATTILGTPIVAVGGVIMGAANGAAAVILVETKLCARKHCYSN